MIQKKNRGVTLVEVLIALTVFLILMTPLVASLITSIKTTDSGKELQSRNDYAEVLMENVKNAPIEDLKDNTKVGSYFDGSENVTVTTSPSTKYPDSDDFTIVGNTYLGTKHTKYSYRIESVYDQKTDSYGIMENLDPNKVAFVPVTFSNYDDVATEAIITQKLDDKSVTDSSIFLGKNDVSMLRNSDADRYVEVVMKGNKASGFEVSCSITYSESGKSITYEPYKQKFPNIPNIYLMYNAGVYNNLRTNDTISYDLTGVDFSDFADKERINAFVIRTSEDYGNILDNYKKDDGTFDDSRLGELTALLSDKLKDDLNRNMAGDIKLYKESLSGSRDYNVTIAGGAWAVSKARFKIYHNLFYLDDAGEKKSLVTVGSGIADNIEDMDDAHEEVFSIYTVKVWIQEGDTVDASDNMVTLQGTRGGGEIE